MGPHDIPAVTVHHNYQEGTPCLHDERGAGGNGALFRLELTVRVVEAVPGGADHVHHVGVHHREVGERAGCDAQHAQVVVQRRGAALDLDAFFFMIHADDFCP